MADTIAKGDIARLKGIMRFVELGYTVSTPLTEDCRYDFIVDLSGKLSRIQAKSGYMSNGTLKFPTASVYKLSGKTVKNHYTAEQIDGYSVYSPHTGKVYYVPIEQAARGMASLRVDEVRPNRGGHKNVKWAKDFEL